MNQSASGIDWVSNEERETVSDRTVSDPEREAQKEARARRVDRVVHVSRICHIDISSARLGERKREKTNKTMPEY